MTYTGIRGTSVLLLSVIGGGLSPHVAAQSAVGSLTPVAIAASGPDEVVVLNYSGDVVRVTSTGERRTLASARSAEFSDIASVRRGAATEYVLCGSLDDFGNRIGRLLFVPGGTPYARTGIAMYGIVPVGGRTTGFFTDGLGAEIRSYEVSSVLEVKYFASVPSSGAVLGPIAADPVGNELYVADVIQGDVWRIATRGGRPTQFGKALRDPRAIVVDDRMVYVAEGRNRRIVRMPRAGTTGSRAQQESADPGPIAAPEFKQPTGLALAGANQLWVGDLSAKAIFLVSTESGRIVRTIR